MGTRITASLTVYLTLVLASGCASSRETGNNDGEIITAVRSVLETQQAAWNRGDIDGFMDGYDRARTTAVLSGDELTHAVYEHSPVFREVGLDGVFQNAFFRRGTIS